MTNLEKKTKHRTLETAKPKYSGNRSAEGLGFEFETKLEKKTRTYPEDWKVEGTEQLNPEEQNLRAEGQVS